jgi:SPP1 family predicted phage head-tail adaptor
MKAGEHQCLVTFQQRSATLNDFGESTDTWVRITEDWAKIEPLSGREFFSALQTQSDVTTRITCRYSSAIAGIKAQDRIVYGATVYDIRTPPINPKMRNRELQFMCTEHVG